MTNYNNNADFALSVKIITAIAFVKIDDIDKVVDELAEYLPDELQDLLDWFEDNYIGRKNRSKSGRRPALFPPILWNVHDRVINDQDRTNNYAEAANRKLNTEMGVSHLTLWSFILSLHKIQSGRDTYYSQLEAGKSPPKKLKKYLDVDKRL
ncbi:uncharacterized protein LOC112680829, partial [Sipha flava]|uniref:Uncharacterized protein LOC112680829 n=1 Tax=Sipha flava TaxID=143950 RepID=A0A8B8F7U4_9HEMI